MHQRRWIEDNAVHDGVTGEAYQSLFLAVVGMLVHVDEHIVSCNYTEYCSIVPSQLQY